MATPTRIAPRTPAQRQRGAVSVVVAFVLVVLLAVLGLVIDTGHLYIVKTELQNAADACALAAARELNDLSAGASDRGKAAGVTAGSANLMDMQRLGVPVAASDVKFSATMTGGWSDTVDNSTVYARCFLYEAVPYSVVQWIGHLGDTNPMQVNAEAIARPVGGKTYCAIPLAVCTNSETADDLFKGIWYKGRLGAGNAVAGNYGWVEFPDAQGAADLAEVIAGPGICSLSAKEVGAQHGIAGGVAQAWNTRFGLYSGSFKDIDKYPPDRIGYAFTRDRLDAHGGVIPGSWPSLVTTPAPPLPAASYPLRAASNAFDGTVYAPPPGSAWPNRIDANYTARKSAAVADPPDLTLLPYDPRALLDDNGKPSGLAGNPSPLAGSVHAEKGQDRRMVFVPVIKCSDWGIKGNAHMRVVDYACVLLLRPINDPNLDVEFEFRGLASKSECGTTGVPGNFGPPVPALVK